MAFASYLRTEICREILCYSIKYLHLHPSPFKSPNHSLVYGMVSIIYLQSVTWSCQKKKKNEISSLPPETEI